MERYIWKSLNRQQIGAYAEYFVKMELTMCGFHVYSPEIDDRGIDFVARHGKGSFIEVQVKSRRGLGYVFMQRSKFELSDSLHLAFVLFSEGKQPDLYLIPSRVWKAPNAVFVSHKYGEGKKSKPEWGLNVSRKNMGLLEPYRLESSVTTLCGEGS